LKNGESNGHWQRVQGEGHVCGGGDGDAAVDDEAVGALEGFEGGGGGGYDLPLQVILLKLKP
jgi:hypothetical protein